MLTGPIQTASALGGGVRSSVMALMAGGHR